MGNLVEYMALIYALVACNLLFLGLFFLFGPSTYLYQLFFENRLPKCLLGSLLLSMTFVVGLLSILTGENPIYDINTIRPYLVLGRLIMGVILVILNSLVLLMYLYKGKYPL